MSQDNTTREQMSTSEKLLRRLERDYPYMLVIHDGKAVIWASQARPLSHEEARAVISAVQRFYSETSPAELQKWEFDILMAAAHCRHKVVAGYLYLMTDGTHYKIGITTQDVEKRRRGVQQAEGSPVTVVWSMFSEDVRNLETQLHSTFDDKRVRGEWFALEERDIELIRGLASE